MSTPIIDARGLACPEPVVLTQQAAKKYDAYTVLVDNRTAVQNITRFCGYQKLSVLTTQEGSEFRMEIAAKGN